jgi:chorismate synthase
MQLSQREIFVALASVNYAKANRDDINDTLRDSNRETSINLEGGLISGDVLGENEMDVLSEALARAFLAGQ